MPLPTEPPTASPFQAPPLADDALMAMKRKEPSTPPGPVALATTTSSAEVASSPPAGSRKKRRTQNRGAKNKGLRHFSLKVCEKVQSKRVTTYNEVSPPHSPLLYRPPSCASDDAGLRLTRALHYTDAAARWPTSW
jgi:hypothetical protein